VHSNSSVIRFVFTLTAIVAVLLAYLSTGLKDIHQRNESVYNKRAILSAVSNDLPKSLKDMTDDDVQNIFDTRITQKVFNMSGEMLTDEQVEAAGYKGGKAENVDLGRERRKPESERMIPMFVFQREDGSNYYIVTVRGNGLWDEIWGNVALDSDFNTIAGVAFDHKAETPGLGAEIKDNKNFPASFIGKKLFNEQGDFVSVGVVKGGARNLTHDVDGISGATITADGVQEMMYRGIKYYKPVFENLKNN
jgi:Na+-transporting NADH:ubiquinone oxidoreductase subunit C